MESQISPIMEFLNNPPWWAQFLLAALFLSVFGWLRRRTWKLARAIFDMARRRNRKYREAQAQYVEQATADSYMFIALCTSALYFLGIAIVWFVLMVAVSTLQNPLASFYMALFAAAAGFYFLFVMLNRLESIQQVLESRQESSNRQ